MHLRENSLTLHGRGNLIGILRLYLASKGREVSLRMTDL